MDVIVSIILPNYNHGKFLEQRIDSILNQSFQDFELIILDDCSTDNSREVIESYRHHLQVSHIVYNETNGGNTFAQWDKGFGLAQGEFIWIAESDDFCEPTLLGELVAPLLENSSVMLSFCQSMVVLDTGEILYTTEASYLEQTLEGELFARQHMMGNNAILNASMVVFRRTSLECVPSDYRTLRYCGDWLFWIHLCLQGDLFISGRVLNYYRRHSNTVASEAVRQGLDFIEGNRIFKFVKVRCAPSKSELARAMTKRIQFYLGVEDQLEPATRRAVLRSFDEIDRNAKRKIVLSRAKHWIKKRLLEINSATLH